MRKTHLRVIELIHKEVLRLGQRGTARATGIPLRSLQKYMIGETEFSQASLQKLADYFNETFIIEVKPQK